MRDSLHRIFECFFYVAEVVIIPCLQFKFESFQFERNILILALRQHSFHIMETKLWKPGSNHQQSHVLNGLEPQLCELRCRYKGEWSERNFHKVVSCRLGNFSNHFRWTKTRSILLAEKELLHVNFLPRRGNSIKALILIKFMRSWAEREMELQPFFSSACKISLKYP